MLNYTPRRSSADRVDNRSFVVGSLPLAFTLSPSQLQLISSIGMGVLVGTSMIVIIPEGVETLYSARATSSQKDVSTRSTAVGWEHDGPAVTANVGNAGSSPIAHVSIPPSDSELASRAIHVPRDDPPASPEQPQNRDETPEDEQSNDDDDDEHDEGSSPHAYTGIALVSGFILMYLVDKLPEFASPKSPRPPHHISLDNLGSGLRRPSSPMADGGLLNAGNTAARSHSLATTTGLVIHAAADGIALGASSSDTGLSFIIFLAIMVHKAPASFGLTSVLLRQGLSSRAARAHLLVFSLAAPVGALATFLFVNIIGSGTSDGDVEGRWRTGMLLLFSAGTFL